MAGHHSGPARLVVGAAPAPSQPAPASAALPALPAPDWCEDPRPWFACEDCGSGLYWTDLDHSTLLTCANHQCSDAGLEVPIWRAQDHREARGLDRPITGPGWPRPVLQGRPVPWLVPVTAGRPWWAIVHGARLLACQHSWLCQVCGLMLEDEAWVLVDDGGTVVSDAAMHEHCQTLASAACPHLTQSGPQLRAALVHRSDITADGKPLPDRPVPWRQQWVVPRLATPGSTPSCS